MCCLLVARFAPDVSWFTYFQVYSIQSHFVFGRIQKFYDHYVKILRNYCESSMLLFVSVWYCAKARCYYSCPYGVMRKLDAIIRVRMVLCESSMLLFVSVWCYAKPRCYYVRIMFLLIRVFRELDRYGLARVIN